MGKKNKGKYNKLGYFGKREADKKMAKQYGIDVSEYGNGGRPGQTSGKKDWDQLKKDVSRAAANDYDVRRSLEAASLSGNKKAQKIGSISNASEAYAASRFMEKTHKKRMGNGGAYDGANDQGSVTSYWVNKDRDKLTENMSSKSPIEKAKEDVIQQEEEYTPSKEMTQAREKVDAWESGGYNNGSYAERKTNFLNNDASIYGAQSTSAAQSQLNDFKERTKKSKNLKPSL